MVYLGPQTYGILKFVVGAYGPHFVRLTEDSIRHLVLRDLERLWTSGPIHQFAGARGAFVG